MSPKNKNEHSLSWVDPNQPKIEGAINSLVEELIDNMSKRPSNKKFHERKEKQFIQEYKHAEQGRSKGGQFMLLLAEAMGIEDQYSAVKLAPMKEISRARETFNNASRNAKDFGRGRILISSIDEYKTFYKLWRSKTKNGLVRGVNCKNTSVVDNSFDDYIKNPRESGYAGTINFDLEINLGKGRIGYFEVQITPEDYIEPCNDSHALYNMIRILEAIPRHFLTEQQNTVHKLLVKANASLFIEHGERTGFIDVRKNPELEISPQELQDINDILTRIRDKIDNWAKKQTRKPKWATKTSNALSYTKTSLINVYYSKYNPTRPDNNLTEPEISL